MGAAHWVRARRRGENRFLPQEHITHSAEETFELAYRIGEELKGGEVFLLSGDLGAGKTVFTKGIAAGLDIDPADVHSPTFTLVNSHNGRLRLFHLDLYRLSDESDVLMDLGLNELIDEVDVVLVIEWAERMGSGAIERAQKVVIEDTGEGLGENDRRITIS